MPNSLIRTVSDIAVNRLFRTASVASVEDPAPGYRTIDLTGDALRGVDWVPGQKVQIRTDGFTTRTYTPTSWDADAGTTTLLAAVHGSGPGSALVEGLAPGDELRCFGPRSSIDLRKVGGTAVFVGDETSVGLALAWRAVGGPARHCIEAQDVATTAALLESLGIGGASVVPAGTPDLAESVLTALDGCDDAHLVLTGRAQSIRSVRAAVKAAVGGGVPSTVKAYWDERRAGLD
jgi:NADPH-dependent ferric siderophore reductase